MARVTSLIGLVGNIDDTNFYKTRNGYFARMKAKIATSRIKNDPEFARTRENNEEFKNAQNASTLIRGSLATATKNVKDGISTGKLFSSLCKVRNADLTNLRGLRTVYAGFLTPKGKSILKGFNFNPSGQIYQSLLNLFELDSVQGVLSINGVNGFGDFPRPPGSDRVGLTLFWSKIDMLTKKSAITSSEEATISFLPSIVQDLILEVNNPLAGEGINIFMIRIRYYQTIGTDQYTLISPADSVLSIIEVT